MKKYTLFIFIISILCLGACSQNKESILKEFKEKTLKEFYKAEGVENAQTIMIVDGSTGDKKLINETAAINEFFELTNEILFVPQKNQEQREGFRYGITLVNGEKEFQFTLNEIKGTYYDTKPDIFPIINEYYKNLEIKEE